MSGAKMMFGGLLMSVLLVRPVESAAPDLTTDAERSRYERTGDYAEVERLCAAYQRQFADRVRCVEFGRTPERRRMLALVVAGDGRFEPASARATGRPVVFLQGGIHPGEIDGKDAGFRYLRDLLTGRVSRRALESVTVVFVPVFNVDGHERRGRWNRPNQTGPAETGWRVTSQNLNLNRDYAKADAPEMQAMLRLLDAWDPVMYVDLHATNGADFEHDISITLEPLLAGDDALAAAGRTLQADILAHLTRHGSLPLSFYPSFVTDDDPQSGFAVSVAPPRFSTGYWPLRNRFAVLVETHSWKPYGVRERATYRTIESVVNLTVRDGSRWSELARAADERAKSLGGSVMPLAFDNDDHITQIDFRGYAYERSMSPISGALMTRYDPKRKQRWRVPLRDRIEPVVEVRAPKGGYLVPAEHADSVGRHLALHGIEYRVLGVDREGIAVDAFRATKSEWARGSSEGRVPLKVEGQWRAESQRLTAGSLFVPIAQAKARLVMALLEPRAPDSYVSWGWFNSFFERREYMEAYVAEQVGADMLARDAGVRAEFERRLAEDAAFRESPAARLDFFYQRHAAWDVRYNRYPIVRLEAAPD